jgi:GNAT superfamily N-acetyltransferase
MGFLIRPAQPEDIATLVGFQLALAWESEERVLDPLIVRRGIEAMFADPGKGQYWIAEESGLALGCLSTTYEWSDWRAGTVLWIQSVYVAKESRERGVYRALHEHIRARVLASPELCGIRLYAARENKSAHAVYVRLGMDPERYQLFEWMK